MNKGAIISTDKIFRYSLWRIWDDTKSKIAFVGLNPSTADDKIDDRTITKCINFTSGWGYGGFYMVNLFALRATDPNELYKAVEIVGIENDKHLLNTFKKVDKVICAWGNHGSFNSRSNNVLKFIDKPFCLKKNISGEPAHPLYLSKQLKPIPFSKD